MSDPTPELPQNLPPSVFLPPPPVLGPYLPPQDFDHGEEFEPAVPRPIPGFLKVGSYARRSRGTMYSLFVLGLMCVVFWPIPFVQGLSFYILPLQYLHWIGLGLIAIAMFQFLAGLVTSGRYKYVKEGTPFVGRVSSINHIACGTQ